MEKIQISFATPLQVIHISQEVEYRAIFIFQLPNGSIQGENMAASMTVGSYATVSVAWKDKGGNVVKVDGPTKWESSDPATLQVTVATGNPQIANLYAPGPIGKVQVHATADADLGEGVKPVTASLDVEVISGQAIGGDITFSQSGAQQPRKTK